MEENRIFPDDWKEVVREKKVILYNTGVSSLLGGREKRIEKMKWVFQIFQEHPEVVLWWRPHPLELSTLQSMLPELEEQYMEVRQQYIEENIGILDESADLNRAIAISDAYYGACSSVAELYKAAGKPALFEKNRIKSMEDTRFLPIAACIKDETIWFIQFNSNKLIKADRSTFEVEKIISIPGEPPYRNLLYNCHIMDIGESLLLLLEKGRRIYEYEIETDTIKTYSPHIENFIIHSEIVIENDHKLYLFPYEGNSILEYDYRRDTTKERRLGEKKIKAAKCYERVGSKIYMADKDSNSLYQYDFSDGSYTATKIGPEDNRYWGVKRVGNCYVLPHVQKKAITIWNEENGEITELTEFPGNYSCLEGYAYLNMYEQNGYLYIFPFFSNMILMVDVKNGKIIQAFPDVFYDVDYDRSSEQFTYAMYFCAENRQGCIYACAAYRKGWDLFHLETETIQSQKEFKIEKTEDKEILDCLLDNNDYEESFYEDELPEICNLENYIKNIYKCDTGSRCRDAERDSIGTCIHQSLINTL